MDKAEGKPREDLRESATTWVATKDGLEGRVDLGDACAFQIRETKDHEEVG